MPGLFRIHIDKKEVVEGRRHFQRERGATLDLLLGLLGQMYARATETVDVDLFLSSDAARKPSYKPLHIS
jgi:hypothetical protein